MASGREPMKVVIINTKYVETDATSFKTVVQELTGKDSSSVVKSNRSPKQRSRFFKEQHVNYSKREEEEEEERISASGVGTSRADSILLKNLSFKEFERLLKEMPPVDDVLWNMG